MKGKEIRREQEYNKKAKMKSILKYIFRVKQEGITLDMIGKLAHTPHRCSSPICCGNPRHTVGRKVLTYQEKVSIITMNEEYSNGDNI